MSYDTFLDIFNLFLERVDFFLRPDRFSVGHQLLVLMERCDQVSVVADVIQVLDLSEIIAILEGPPSHDSLVDPLFEVQHAIFWLELCCVFKDLFAQLGA